jgi:hypothetical protein
MTDHDEFNYESILEMAKERKCQVPDLLAMNPKTDPFFAGAPKSREEGEWFAKVWQHYAFPEGSHIRRIHYALANAKSPPKLPDGTLYENTDEHSQFLERASRSARHLGLVDPMAFTDARNPEPPIFAQYDTVPGPHCEIVEPDDWALPSIPKGLLDVSPFEMPTAEISGYDYAQSDQPYHLEVWIEKSTQDDILIPLCEEHHVNFVPATGFQSITGVLNAIKRIRDLHRVISGGKPVVIFYIADFDPAGELMSLVVARILEFYLRRFAPDADVKLVHLALTKAQVEEFDLPRIPIKEKDKRKESFEARHGRGATELDALEALYPGELARIVREAVAPYRDDDIEGEIEDAGQEAEDAAQEAIDAATQEEQEELDEIAEETAEVCKPFAEELKRMRAELDKKLKPLQRRLNKCRRAVGDKLDDLALELPERPESQLEPPDDGDEALFSTDRDYEEQLTHYHAHSPPRRSKRKALRTVVCEFCGVKFQTKRDDKSICSPLCAQRQKAAREKAQREPVEPRFCQICHEEFVPGRSNQWTCSRAECQKKRREASSASYYRQKRRGKQGNGRGKRKR